MVHDSDGSVKWACPAAPWRYRPIVPRSEDDIPQRPDGITTFVRQLAFAGVVVERRPAPPRFEALPRRDEADPPGLAGGRRRP